MKTYDLVVIGTGSAASSTAFTYRENNLTVAIIDERPYGGTCAQRGCDPKKVLVGAANIIDASRRMAGYGIDSKNEMKWKDLIKFKRTFTDPVSENREEAFKEAGMDCYHGTASMASEDKILVDNEIIGFKNLLIASGAKPRPLSIQGEEFIIHSDDFMELNELPKEIVFIGGGFISFEFAHIAARAGANVQILQKDKNPLKNFDTELVDLLIKHSKERGIAVQLDTEPKSIEKKGDRFIITMKESSSLKTIECDLVVHGAGRVPNIDALNLEKGNVSAERKGVKVNDYLQSVSNPRVYAAGDVSSSEGLPLTPVASMESKVVAHNLLHENKKTANYEIMPSIVFSIPPLAILGLTEEKAKEKGINVMVRSQDVSDWYTYKRTRESVAMVKTVADKKSGKLLGVHILGENAAELINYFALIMKFDLPLDEVKNMIFAYPTSASDLSYLL